MLIDKEYDIDILLKQSPAPAVQSMAEPCACYDTLPYVLMSVA